MCHLSAMTSFGGMHFCFVGKKRGQRRRSRNRSDTLGGSILVNSFLFFLFALLKESGRYLGDMSDLTRRSCDSFFPVGSRGEEAVAGFFLLFFLF